MRRAGPPRKTLGVTIMNAILKISAVLVAVATVAGSAFGEGYNWQQKTTYANDPTRASMSRGYVTPGYAAQPQVESRQAFSYEPAPMLKAGDVAVVAKAMSALKIGDRTL